MLDKKRTIIITGANGNIGSAMASYLAGDGYSLILLWHKSRKRIDEMAGEFNTPVKLIQADITDLTQLENLIEEIRTGDEFFPGGLIHTAAKRSVDSAALTDSDPALWKSIFETNVIGTYNILRTIIPLLKSKRVPEERDDFSRIVLLGSDVSRIGLPFGSAYAASKAAISNLTRSLASELAKQNILINAVSPGPVEMDDSHFPAEYRRFRAEYYEEMLKRTPLGRLANLTDIISFCSFLVSEQNQYITGEEFYLTGGKL